jgi:T5SS/PEP-CTERM-associated repeat protein
MPFDLAHHQFDAWLQGTAVTKAESIHGLGGFSRIFRRLRVIGGLLRRAYSAEAAAAKAGSSIGCEGWIIRGLFFVGLLLGIMLGPRSSEAQYTGSSQTNIINGVSSNWATGSYIIGDTYTFDVLQIIGGGSLTNSGGDTYIGNAASASNNAAWISGTGSMLTNGNGNIYIGFAGRYNSLVISNGGKVFQYSGIIGSAANASNNTVLVTDAGSSWICASAVAVGSSGAQNSMIISNGGQVWGASHGVIGGGSAATSNSVLVVGAGSLWTEVGQIECGSATLGNSLTISNSGSVVCSNLIIGVSSSTGPNKLTVNGGYLTVTNAQMTSSLKAFRGAFVINAGTVTTDQLVLTNFGGYTSGTFNGGTVTVNKNLITALDVPLWFGLGTNSPTINTSNLTLQAVLHVTDGGGFGYGTYTLFTYTGTLVFSNLTLGLLPFGYREALDTNTVGKIKLVVTPLLARDPQSDEGWLAILSASNTTTLASFSAVGSANWTCPAGISNVIVECWGSGGGGATFVTTNCGGGGGGAYSRSVLALTPGNTYTSVIGGGGGVDNDGTNTTFNTNTVVAAGGKKGVELAGGLGGATADGTGDVKYSGGTGGAGVNTLVFGGGGGGGAGNAANGGNGQDMATAGIGGVKGGGNGGTGANTGGGGTAASPGVQPGGGGGGGHHLTITRPAAAGAPGKVIISWTHL